MSTKFHSNKNCAYLCKNHIQNATAYDLQPILCTLLKG